MRHVSLTCKNHPDLRWSCKEVAWGPTGYNRARNLHYYGVAILDAEGVPVLFSDKSGTKASVIRPDGSYAEECSCPTSELIRAPEDEVIEQAFNAKYPDNRKEI